jgi:prepilin-type N-terminal cleavage/methylation domain-containing protein/prepilin-type processing-associated H-X9-DG protein
MSRTRGAFTLVELLVVIAILAVLAALAFPAVQEYAERGKVVKCVQNLRTLGAALNLYLAENDGQMPTMLLGREKITDDAPVIDNTLDRYVSDKAVFACPSDPQFAKLTGTSYHWNNALNKQHVSALRFMLADQPMHIPLMGDKEGFHKDPEHKVNILYADGHASKELTFVDKKK